MGVVYVALIAGLLPLLGVHISYVMAAYHHEVSWCIPYLTGCSSISEAGRQPPASYVFRATVISGAVFMIFYWQLMKAWLQKLGDNLHIIPKILPYLGTVACLFLIIYATVLGSEGDFYQLLRRHGIIVFFGLTALAQLLTTYRLAHFKQTCLFSIFYWKLGICSAQLGLGLISIPILAFYEQDEIKDILEWNFALLMMSFFILSYIAWRITRFQIIFKINSSAQDNMQ